MKTLFLMRHAKSSWGDHSLADHDRPLNDRGREDAPRVGEYLTANGLIPDLILCSTAVRARQTVEKMLKTLLFEGEVRYSRDLYHAGTEEYSTTLSGVPNKYKSVMLVGHNPGMEMAIEDFTGEWVRMSTGSVAEIALDIQSWADVAEDLEGELRSIIIPRELR